MTTDPDCELCSLIHTTHVYFNDQICIVLDCDDCGEPMIVWKKHGIIPPPKEMDHMFRTLFDSTVGTGQEDFQFDAVRYKHKNHWHAHLRPIGRIIHDR